MNRRTTADDWYGLSMKLKCPAPGNEINPEFGISSFIIFASRIGVAVSFSPQSNRVAALIYGISLRRSQFTAMNKTCRIIGELLL